jgi:predicted nucleic acid-binding protein
VTRYLLDTDVLIDYAKGRNPVVARIRVWLAQGDELGVCAVNVAEFVAGLPPADRPYWRTVLGALDFWPLPFAAAVRAGEWRRDFAQQGQTLATADTLTAAAALQADAALVTRNVRHYPMPGLRLVDPSVPTDSGARSP